tara:strand:- start:264 stop:431 length:168 start_codon:yes stop_codon:yes gene_type:complete
MTKKQLVGLALIVIAGALSQWTNFKENDLLVWILALTAVAGMLLVMSDWLKPKND